MLYYALMFLVVGLIAGALNLAGVAAVAAQISWILFLIGIVLVAIHVITWIAPLGLHDWKLSGYQTAFRRDDLTPL